MLGLRQQIRGDDARVRAVVREDQDLARSGDAVDVDLSEDEALGGRNVEVARADDLVDARHRLRAVRERGDGLRAARIE